MASGQQQDLFFLELNDLEDRVHGLARRLISKPVRKILWESLQLLNDHHHEAYKGELRVTLIAEQMARFLDQDPKYAVIGGLAHDIGKKDIPLDTLRKSYSRRYGPWLTSDMETMMAHPYLGYDYLMKQSQNTRLSDSDRADVVAGAWIAETSHQRQRNFYPEKLPSPPKELVDSGLLEIVNSSGLIVTLADQYEACYRDNPKFGGPLDHDRAKKEMIGFTSDETTHLLIERLFDEEKGIL